MWKIGTPVVELDVLNSAFGNGKNKGKVTISPPVKLYFDILRVFDNELLINLYWQCLRYLKFLYPQRNEKRPVYAVEGRLSQEQINDMKQDFDDYFTSMQDEVLDFIETAREEYHLENVKQIPFSWIICRRRLRCVIPLLLKSYVKFCGRIILWTAIFPLFLKWRSVTGCP